MLALCKLLLQNDAVFNQLWHRLKKFFMKILLSSNKRREKIGFNFN